MSFPSPRFAKSWIPGDSARTAVGGGSLYASPGIRGGHIGRARRHRERAETTAGAPKPSRLGTSRSSRRRRRRLAAFRLLSSLLLIFLGTASAAFAGSADPPSDSGSTDDRLALLQEEGRWEEILKLLPPPEASSAHQLHLRGLSLSRLQRWDEAFSAFETGARLFPSDSRFPLGTAGVHFRRGEPEEALRDVRRALKLDPRGGYAHDFAATLYLLQDNLEAALRHWNRTGKPYVENVRLPDLTGVDPVLLDRALVFSPAARLDLDALYESRARLELMDVFARHRFRPIPRADGSFDLALEGLPRPGWSDNRTLALAGMLRGLPLATVHPEFHNLGEGGVGFRSLFRWDVQKRRLALELAGPLQRDPGRRWSLFADVRNENWDMRDTLRTQELGEPAFNLLSWEAGVGWEAVAGSRTRLGQQVALGRRLFRSGSFDDAASTDLLAEGLSIESRSLLRFVLLRDPARRFRLETSGRLDVGRVTSGDRDPYARLETALLGEWFPRPRGENLATRFGLRGGLAGGDLPVDRLFNLRLERDNEVGLRGHAGTREGLKGAGPRGRRYLLAQGELDFALHEGGLLRLSAGPFLDAGRIFDSWVEGRWLWDAGIQWKAGLPGGPGLVVSYGRNLRDGTGAWYVIIQP